MNLIPFSEEALQLQQLMKPHHTDQQMQGLKALTLKLLSKLSFQLQHFRKSLVHLISLHYFCFVLFLFILLGRLYECLIVDLLL